MNEPDKYYIPEVITDEMKLECAERTIRDALTDYAAKEGITYEEALAELKKSLVYEAWLDLETELWKEGPAHLIALWEIWPKKE